ncbi:hypothetical protein VE02_05819 [Pseudogymnoascus sp. 03VT05]|nr:hypothetical protein VE02_05819 [Pseudogymnoascus sp. 03VT05]
MAPPSGLAAPSTIDSGFMLSVPQLENPYTSDDSYQRVLEWYLPLSVLNTVRPKLSQFGDEAVSEQIHQWVANAEKEQPYVKTHDVWGKRYPYDRLVTSHGWKEIGKWGARNGVMSLAYEGTYGHYSRIVQHAFNYTYSASSAVYSCPTSMTSGAARLMAKQLPGLPLEHPFHEIFNRLTARENHWVSSQWMTERPGGSDVQNSETVAVYSPLPRKTGKCGRVDEGDWLVSGFKFFSSATDCNIALMLAKTESGQLSLFVAPTRKTILDSNGKEIEVTNGVRIHRLKVKMGTKQLPTAELELKDVRAWRVGPADRGIATIAQLLNVTRTHNFITALSCWRRGMAIAKSFAKTRTTINQPLATFPMHLRLLSSMEVKHRGLLQFAFFTTALLGFADDKTPANLPASYAPLPDAGEQMQVVLRTFTATAKAVICKVSTVCLQECQEAMGGVGYMDEPDEPELNVSRLLRDTAANMTWEGTTNVLSSEVVRHLLNKNHLDIFGAWIERAIGSVRDNRFKQVLDSTWKALRQRLLAKKNKLSLALAEGRQSMFTLAWIVSGTLLAVDAQRDGNASATEIARRWILHGEGGLAEYVFSDIVYGNLPTDVQDEAERGNWDCRLVWGTDLPKDAAAGYRTDAKLSKL